MKHLNIKVTGVVQGVYFRVNTRDEAIKLGVKGFVKNDEDGSVYIEAEGGEELLDTFVAWCHHGKDKAVVDKLTITEGDIKNFNDFTIKY